MADRAIWRGAISFGMVTIPVKLFTATRSQDIAFHLLHATCGSRLQQKRWCPTDDVEVPWSEVVRGYEYAKGHYVVLTDVDLEQLPLPSKHTVELVAFVGVDEIDPVFYEKAYYLAPDERAEKPYALLLRALEEKQLVAVGTVTLSKKERLCAVRPANGQILLETLYYRDEVSLARDVDLGKVKVAGRELEMAFTLIDLLRKPFRPEDYHDHYREALMELIQTKLEGKEVVAEAPKREAKVINLADALAKSVAAARKGQGRPAARRKAKAPATRRRRRAGTG